MASEYLKWKYRDVRQREKHEYTPEEKRRNWWHYNKWFVIGGVIGAILLTDLVLTMLGLRTRHPDVQIAFLTEYEVSPSAVKTLQDSLAAYADDYNGDKKVIVEVRQFVMPDNPSEEQSQIEYASQIALLGDLEECGSFLFMIRDPDAFQNSYEVLCYPDGTLPPAGTAGSDLAVAADTLKAFASEEINLPLREYLKEYYIARRGFWTDKTCANYEGCAEFFAKIIQP